MKGLVAGVVAAVVAGPVGLLVLLGGGAASAGGQPVCASAGPLPGLTAEQAGNARTIVAVTGAVAAPTGPAQVKQAAVIALMTAAQESGLRDLANPAVSGSAGQPGASGSGDNLDSVGLFQQRASWGTVAQRMDPVWATTAFVSRLLAVSGWWSMPATDAAQAVQGSAFPDAYARSEVPARGWLAAIDAGPSGADCGGSGLPARAGARLPAGYALPAGTSARAATAVAFALAQLGKPYVFGAAGRGAYDCSGLTMAAWAAAGVALPHHAADQAQLGVPVAAVSLLRPGDLVFIPGSDGTMAAPGHVGMYVGAGLIIEAPDVGQDVKLVPLWSFGPIAAMRHYA